MNDKKEKFTPGPWFCTDMGQIGKKGEKRLFCLASFHWEGVGEKEMMANTKLATAAPEMYDLLKRIKGMLQFCELEDKIDADTEHEIGALLAKARGEVLE